MRKNIYFAFMAILMIGSLAVISGCDDPKDDPTNFTVTITSAGTNSTGSGTYAKGASVTIFAGTPPGNKVFDEWTTTSAGVNFANKENPLTTFVMPGNNVTVVANFKDSGVTYAVTVISDGTGSSGSGDFAAGVPVQINAGTPPGGMMFDNWTSDKTVVFDNDENPVTFFTMIGEEVTVTANFTELPPGTHAVTVQSAGSGASGSGPYANGVRVDIDAGTYAGHTFKNWTSYPAVVFDDDESPVTFFTMIDENVTVTANWDEVKINSAVTVVSQGEGKTGDGNFDQGVTVNIYAGNLADHNFTHWTSSPAVVFASDISATTSFVMIGEPVTVTAHFAEIAATFTVTINGTATGAGSFAADADVTVEATDWQLFASWTIVGVDGLTTSTANPLTFKMPPRAVTLTVNNYINVPFTPQGTGGNHWNILQGSGWDSMVANPGGTLRIFMNIAGDSGGHFQSGGSGGSLGNRIAMRTSFYADQPILRIIENPIDWDVNGTPARMVLETWGGQTVQRMVIIPGTAVVNIRNIGGIPLPHTGDPAPTTITPTSQFTGTISWNDLDGVNFAPATVHTATITLTAANQFTFAGLNAGHFLVEHATSVNFAGNTVTAVFPITGGTSGQEVVVNETDIRGVPAPVFGGAPVTTPTRNEIQYDYSAITWSYSDDSPIGASFGAGKDIKAVFTLTANEGFTFNGFNAVLTCYGAAVTYTPNPGTGESIVVTVIYPEFEDLSDETKSVLHVWEAWGQGSVLLSRHGGISFDVGSTYEIEIQFKGQNDSEITYLFMPADNDANWNYQEANNLELKGGNAAKINLNSWNTGAFTVTGTVNEWSTFTVHFTALKDTMWLFQQNGGGWGSGAIAINYIGIRKVEGGAPVGPNLFPAMGTDRGSSAFRMLHHDDKWGYDTALSPRWPAWVNIR